MSQFTSKLPVSTSVRRPNNPIDGSASFGGAAKYRQSNIPSTVRKANLFTPQTKNRTFSTGASTAGKSYMSAGPNTDKKYQRPLKPIPDRDQQIRMFDVLVDFLKSKAPQLPLPEAKKFFSSISTTESTRIFEVLIGRLLPEFKITRLEVDVPEALTILEYPYIRTVTKSALVSVTTRQAVVGLLRIFCWLIDAANQCEDEDIWASDIDEPINEVREIYKFVITDPTNVTPLMRTLFDKLYPCEDKQTKVEELEELTMEVANLKHELELWDKLEEESETADRDTVIVTEYLEKMKIYVRTAQEEEEDEKQKSMNLKIQLQELNERSERVRIAVKNHEFTFDEVAADKKALTELETQDARLSQDLTDLKVQLENGEKSEERLAEQLREAKKQYYDKIRQLSRKYEQQLQGLIKLKERCKESHFTCEFSSINLLMERKNQLDKVISYVESVRDKSLEQIQKVLYDLCMFCQKLIATNPNIESKVSDDLTEFEIELDSLNTKNTNFLQRELPLLHEELKKREGSIKIQKGRQDEELINLDLQIKKADIELEGQREKLVSMEKELPEKLSKETKTLEAELACENELKESRDIQLNNLMRQIEDEVNKILETSRIENRQLEETYKICDLNKKIVKRKMKKLKKKLTPISSII